MIRGHSESLLLRFREYLQMISDSDCPPKMCSSQNVYAVPTQNTLSCDSVVQFVSLK